MVESKKKECLDNRIAIVGISSILPGGENINECWETIRAGLDKIEELPADRLDVTAYYNPEKGVKDKIYCKRGGFIPDFDFDAREFGMNMFQVEDADTNQTLTLLKVKEALEDAGVEAFGKKKNIGVVLGIGGGQKASNEFYSRMNYIVVDKVLRKMGLPDADVENAVEKFKNNFPEWRLDSFPGFLGNVTAGRCTNVFNLTGMNCVVDAACASSLIALKVAIDELLHGDADEMICGATCTDNSIGMFMAFSKTPVFSTDNSLTAYDENTKGMLIGEGSVMMLLKRYEDAVRDGDNIHAVIRGVASSSDGKASGIYSPTIDGQELAIARAYEKAGVNPADVSLVEGHGTGTPVGDRIELTGLKNVFTPHFKGRTEEIAVGSIKSQIGHLKAVAGMAGLVKVIMGLKHKVLPPSINVKNPPALYDNTRIQDSPLYINTKMRPWFTNNGLSRLAGVSSFGFGGANYHCVVEEAEVEQTKPYRMHDLAQPVVLSAASAAALLKVAQSELQQIESMPKFISLHNFRNKFQIRPIPESHARVGFLAENVEQTIEALKQIVSKLQSSSTDEWTLIRQGCFYRSKGVSVKGKVAALFSGQGSQYVNMFSDVAMNWPTFRESVTKMDKKSEQICGVRTSKILYPRQPYDTEPALTNDEISTVRNAQISTVACSIGSYNIFKKAGFTADFVAGHSLGEFSALYAAGCVSSEEDVFELVCHRAKIMQDNESNKGAMLAVIGAGANKIKITNQNVWVGNSNSPDQIVLTGESSAIDKEAEVLKSKFKVVKLNVSDAFHSTYMSSANDKFLAKLGSKSFKSPSAKIYSNVSAAQYKCAPEIELKNHMTSGVRFEDEITTMYNAGARVFVEFGPRNTLIKLAENILKGKSDIITIAVNNTSKTDSESQLRECALKMCVTGIPMENFDPWPLVSPFKLKETEKKKTTLRLSAATYVSGKSLKAREAIMNDGYTVNAGSCGIKTIVDHSKEQKLEQELGEIKQQNNDLVRQLKVATEDVDKLRKRLDAMEGSTASATASVRDDFVEINTIKKHRDMIVGMLSEYDKMIDTLSSYDAADHEEKSFIEITAPKSAKPVAVNSDLLARAEKVVLQVLAEKTGYDVEMIEADMELETELGIDSIKRVEILSEVQSILNIEAKDVDALSRTRTVGEVVNAMKFEISSGTEIQQAPAPSRRVVEEPAKNQALLNNAEQAVMKVLAEKTGYEVEMIENDMELETELGIDSIKRVEILSEVQSILNIEAKDVDALSRTRTVGEVIDAMKNEISQLGSVKSISTAAPIQSKPLPQVSAPAPVASKATSQLAEKAAQVVLQVLAEKTGYEVEMIEMDMELETELGIDSIKRVEILSEVQSTLNIEAKDVDALSRTRTVGEVVNAIKSELGATTATPSSAPVPKQTQAVAAAPKASANPDLLKKAADVVLQVLAEKTGYEVEMIEPDMELETELGIDSIKRVEILSEVQSLLNIEAKDVDALSRTRTVGEVISAMKAEIGGAAVTTSAPVRSAPASAPVSGASSAAINNAEKVVLQVLAEKTGYEVEMIENDMELETELGIDSIKRVEILSEVQAILNVEAKDVDALSRTRTVGEVVDAMKKEIGGSAPAAAVPSQPKAAVVAPAASVAKVDSSKIAKAEEAVLKVLAEKTGYEVEMIENDMELETELGIDSIKRVEILSEVQSMLNIEAKDVDALSRTRTVGEVIAAMKKEIGGSASSVPKVSAPQPTTVKAAAPVVSTASTSAVDSSAAEKAVLQVLAEKTGYEVDMIEQDMELETELGIDSIKRVEILSEVQSMLNIEAKDVDALSRTRTVGEVIDALKKELGSTNAPSVPSTASSFVVVSSNGTSTASSGLLGKAEDAVLQVLAEKTGYEVEMIEADMELETELGIDSIKRVEILSEVQSMLNIEAKDVDALSRTRTVGEVIAAMKKEIGSAGFPVQSSSSVAPKTVSKPALSVDTKAAEQAVLKVLAEKTGYEVDMIENDMELETELGIDSIKRVEILSEVQSMLNVEAKDVDALSRTRTVGEVIAALQKEMSSGSPSTSSKPTVSHSITEFATQNFDFNNYHIRAKGCEELNLSFPTIVEIDPATREDVKLGSIVVSGDGNNINEIVSFVKSSLNTPTAVVSNAGTEDQIKSRVASASAFETFVYVHGDEPIENALCFAKYLRTKMNGKRAQVLFVVRGDGMLGYGGEFNSVSQLEKYSLCGLAKTIALEWPEVKSRLVDISSEYSAAQASKIISAEILDSNRMIREVGYKNNKRFGVCIKGLTSVTNHTAPSSSDVWIVAGGARGITPLCIRELAKQVKGGRYILVGRSKLQEVPAWAKNLKDISEQSVQKAAIAHMKSIGQKPKPMDVKKIVDSTLGSLEVKANMEDISRFCNGNVEYQSCDINDASNVKTFIAKLTSSGTKITGFFHASGVLRDKLIEQKPIKDFNVVYDTKVRGFDNIYSCLDKSALKHCVIFSSLAGFYGNTGQSDYSMANEVLNKLAYFLSTKNVTVKAFDFGPWDGGMVTPALKKHFLENNVQIIERDPGAETVAKIIMNSPARQVLVGNWGLAPKKPSSKVNVVDVIFKNKKFIADHSIKGVPVLPFTFTLSNILEQVCGFYPGYYVKEVKSVKLFRGIKFDSNEVPCQLTLEEKSDSGDVLAVAKLAQVVSGKAAPSYQAEIVLSPSLVSISEKPWSVEVNGAKTLSSSEVYDGVTLFHGPAFQSISQVKYSDTQIIAKVDLTQAQFNDLGVTPVLLDTVYQAALVLGRKIGNKASLPSTLENVKLTTQFFDGSRSYQNCFICMKRINAASDSTWKFDFTIQDDKVLCKGEASITLNENLSFA